MSREAEKRFPCVLPVLPQSIYIIGFCVEFFLVFFAVELKAAMRRLGRKLLRRSNTGACCGQSKIERIAR